MKQTKAVLRDGVSSRAGKVLRKWLSVGIVGLGAFCLTLADSDAQQLSKFVKDDFDWEMTGDEFEKEFGEDKGFEWVSSAKNASRHPGKSRSFVRTESPGDGKITGTWETVSPMIGKMKVGESIARFTDGKISLMEISLYNRGDDGELDKKDYEKKIESFKALISKLTGASPKDTTNRKGAVRTDGYRWKGESSQYMLEYSSSRNERYGKREWMAEFIKLKIAPSKAGQSLLEAVAERSKSGPKSRETLVENVVKDSESGDVYIENVPMVDQGSKGYCAVASAERVLRYYGLEVDQHQMAQISQSSSGGGTSPKLMTAALKDVAGRLKVHMRTHEEIEDYDAFEKIVKKYNRVAKRNDAKEIPIRPGYYLMYTGCWQRFDADSLRESREKDFDRFFETVQEKVDEGIPILWSLFLGVYPEENIPQPSGGHMRLIIGYNKGTKEIIFSDSWGAGHEKKRMDAMNAYAMTTGVRTLRPFR